MSTRLAILGFLREQPLYGYELKQIIEKVMGDWADIAFGSIYFALKKLAEEGFVEKAGTEREGGRPSRTVYRITEAGRREFLRLLAAVWNNIERQTFEFDFAIAFIGALPVEEMKGYLRKRVQELEKALQLLAVHQEEETSDEHVPQRLAAIAFDHHRVHMNAELEWTRSLLRNLEAGVYDAELDWMRGLFTWKEQEDS